MADECTVLIAEHIDLLFEALLSYVLMVLPEAQIVRVEGLGELLQYADRAAQYALIVLDRDMPGFAGLPSVDELLQSLGRSALVLLSARFQEEDISHARRHGAKTCLSISAPRPMILAGLGLVACGQTYFPRNGALPAQPTDAHIGDDDREHAAPPVAPEKLTPRQRQVLELLALGKSNAEIAMDLGLAEPTIRLHLRAVYRRLGVRSRTQAMRAALQMFSGTAERSPWS